MTFKPNSRVSTTAHLAGQRWFAVSAIAALALLAQACSGEESASTTTNSSVTSLAPTSQPPDTTVTASTSPTSTTALVPSSSAATTSTSTSAPPVSSTSTSTTPATSSTVPLDPTAAEAADAYRAVFESWTECLGNLPNCSLESLAATRAGSYLDAAVLQAGRYNESGQTVDGLETRMTTVESVEVTGEKQANVVACEVDASVRRDAAGSIVTDSFDSARVVFVMTRDDETWKVIGSEVLETGTGPEENVCAP